MKVGVATIALALCAACGGAGDGADTLQIALRQHQLQCDIPALQAALQVIGRDGDCPLTVNADRTVTGSCDRIPTGFVIEVRLVYDILLAEGAEPVQLATATEPVDLRSPDDEQVTINFDSASLTRDFDDDGDKGQPGGGTNLEEVCMNGNPRGQ